MTSTNFPANLVHFRPRYERHRRHRVRASRAAMVERHELLERLETVGELAPSAPLSFLVVQVRGLSRLAELRHAPSSESVLRAAAAKVRDLSRPTDHVGRFTGSTVGVVLQGTGSTAASAVAARLTFHLNQVLGAMAPSLHAAVYAATGVGANAEALPAAALDELDECC